MDCQNVPGISRPISLPNPRTVVSQPSAARNSPLAPIFSSRRPGTATSQPTTRDSSPPPETQSTSRPAHERAIPEVDGDIAMAEEEGDMDGEGLGGPEEGDEEDEDDVDPDGRDEDEEGASGTRRDGATQGAKARKRAPMPEWLEVGFNERIRQCNIRNHLDQPRLYYERKMLYLPKQSNCFRLQKNNVTPEKLYNPTFFLWDPLALCAIPFPNCSTQLNRHPHISRPRRVVSLTSTFWMIGFRYRCPRCSLMKPAGKRLTFRSWDTRILERCKPEVAAEFPATEVLSISTPWSS